jgi:uncharacterized protein YcfL
MTARISLRLLDVSRGAFFVASMLSVLPSCSQGPLALDRVDSPDASIIIDRSLAGTIGLPVTQAPTSSFTADGRMLFNFHLQNQSGEKLRLQYRATFYDEAGVVADEQSSMPLFLNPYEIRAARVDASNPRAKRVLVQVRPAQ